MKATLIDKGDGWATMRYEAENNVEAMIVSQVALNRPDEGVNLSLHAYKPISSVLFGSVSIPVVEFLDEVK